ncbi:MAG: hypothetical protein M1833_003867 [Piccolia ochrophora]|nr:MAG: hypothetical protein M1833_003867 [Piccolia ochrophora]
MAPMAPHFSEFFPPLDKCLDGQQSVLNRDSPLERFLSDPQTVNLLGRPFDYFGPPTSETRSSFEARTAAIHVPPVVKGRYDINQIKDDVLWLSKEANIDEVSALRVAIIEWQSRPRDQLLACGVDDEGSGEALSGEATRSTLGLSVLFPSSSLWTSSLGDPSFGPFLLPSPESRHLRLVKYYLSERRYILKLSEMLICSALRNNSLSALGGESYSNENGAETSESDWIEGLGKTIFNARVTGGGNTGRKDFLLRCVETLQMRLDGLGEGSGLFKDEPRPDVEAAWGINMLLEMIHIMQLMFFVLDSTSDVTNAAIVLAWVRFASKYSFFDEFQPPFEDPQNHIMPFQSLIAIVSLAILKLSPCLSHLLEPQEYQALPSEAPDSPFILDAAALVEISSLLIDVAGSGSPIASPALFAWAIILQHMREMVLSKKEAREIRQSQRAADGFTQADNSETESGGVSTASNERAQSERRQSTGSDASLEPSIYAEVLEKVVDGSSDDDPIAYLAKSAVNGGGVFDVIVNLATEFCTICGSDGHGVVGSRMRLTLLELVRASLDWVAYSPQVVAAALGSVTGAEPYWDTLDRPLNATNLSPATFFVKDDTLLIPKLFDLAYARFPYEPLPFLKLVGALSSCIEVNDSGILHTTSLLEMMTSFTEALPDNFRGYDTLQEEDNSNRVILTSDLDLFRNRESRLLTGPLGRSYGTALIRASEASGGGTVTIPTGTEGRVVLESNPVVVQWTHQYSALLYLGTLLRLALPDVGSIDRAIRVKVDKLVIAEIVALFATLLHASTKATMGNNRDTDRFEAAHSLLASFNEGDDLSKDIVTVIFDLLEDELQQHRSELNPDVSTELLIHGVQFVHAFTAVSPGRVWPFLARSELLPIEGRGGRLASVVASTEVVSGHFDFLIATIRLFEALVEDALTNAVARKAAGKTLPRFAQETYGISVSENTVRKVLLAFARTVVEMYESVGNWTFAVLDERLEVHARITALFIYILENAYGIDDTGVSKQQIVGTLAPTAAYIVNVFLSPAANDLPISPLLRTLLYGVQTPRSTIYLKTVGHWVSQTQGSLNLCTLLIRVNALLGRPTSHLETQLFNASALLARLYSAHEAYRLPVIELLQSIISSASQASPQPPSLLGYMGATTAKNFITVISGLDEPLADEELRSGIWRLLSAIVSSRQQWLATYLITGRAPRESLNKNGSEASHGSVSSRSLLTVALDSLSNISKVSPHWALPMLEFIGLAQDQWSWAMSDLQTHPNFLTSITEYVGQLKAGADQEEDYDKMQMASYIAEILAMHLLNCRQFGDTSFVQKVLPNISYFVDNAVRLPGYNSSLVVNVRRNFQRRFGLELGFFKHTTLRKKPLGPNFYYNLDLLNKTLMFDRSWRGGHSQGLAEDVRRANLNISLVEAQIQLLSGWTLLAIELCSDLPQLPDLQNTMAKVVNDCLTSNAQSSNSEAIFDRLVQSRADFAFTLLQKLNQAKSPAEGVKQVFPTAWSTIRTSGANFDLAVSNSDVEYYRSLLRVLLLSLQPHHHRISSSSSSRHSAGNDPKWHRTPNILPAQILETVLEVIDAVVARGFRELAGAVHDERSNVSPSDLTLVTAILHACLLIPGVETIHPQICSQIAEHGTARVATTLFSWADRLPSTEGDPIYGELSILFLVELSSMPLMAEALAVAGVLAHLNTSPLATLIKRGVHPLSPTHPRLHTIWARGFLKLCINLLRALDANIAPEIVLFLNSFPTQLSRTSHAYDSRTSLPSNTPNQQNLTLPLASETHDLALLSRILTAFHDAGAGTGVLPTEIPPLAWDAKALKEDIEVLLNTPRALAERIVPVGPKEVTMASEKADGKDARDGGQSRLEERMVGELRGIVALLEG